MSPGRIRRRSPGGPRGGPRGRWPLALLIALSAPSALSGQEGAFVIGAFEVQGEQTLAEERVVALSGLREGEPVTLIDLREAVRRIWDAELFADVAADLRATGGPGFGGATPVTVVLEVREAPIASEVVFEGNEEVDDDDLAEALAIRQGARLLPSRVAAGERAVRELYQEKGYYLARTEARVGTPDATLRAPLEVRVREGSKVAVAEIRFQGNQGLDEGELRGAMETETEGFFWWQDGEFREDVLQADLAERLPRVYADHGYLDAAVLADSFAVDSATGKGVLTIEVREGPQYVLGEVEVRGNTRFPTEYLAALLETDPGEPYSEEDVQEAATALRQLYNNEGYIYAQIAPERRKEPGEPPVVDVVWQVREGEPAEVQRIVITGNTVTHEKVIRRNLYIFPGDRFREAALVRSLNNLRNLRYFSEIRPDTRIVNEKGDIDLILEVKEQRTGTLNLGAALGGGTGLSGFLGYEQPNLFGQGKFGRLRWEFGRRNNNLELSYTEPTLFDSRTSASVDFRRLNRRLTGVGFREKLTGGGLAVSTPFPWLDYTRVRTSYGLREIDLESTRSTEDRRFKGYPRTESTLGLQLVRDTRDLARNSTSGTRHELSLELTGGLLQGSSAYQKYRMETSWFMPTFGRNLVLNLRAKGGAIAESGFVPLSEQFILGGVQYPGEGLRGYPDNSVGVNTAGVREDASGNFLNDRGNAFVVLTAEHFFRISDAIGASLFFDAGNVWESLGSADFGQYKRGAGVGATVEIPGFGPIGLDYAYGFDRRDVFGDPNPKWQLHFKFGQFFQ
ncbi:MAG: outer membrane protein assembly factor BamA [Gemmatimonadota bacterium]